MLAETLFYVSGAVFFSLFTVILIVVLVCWMRFFRAVFILKEKIEKTAEEVVSKTAAFSLGLSAITSLLERMMSRPKRKKQEKSENKNQ